MYFFVYVLESMQDNSSYIGYTNNMNRRIEEHNQGLNYDTKRKIPWKIIYYEVSLNKFDAIAREKYLKSGMGRRYLKNRLKNQISDF